MVDATVGTMLALIDQPVSRPAISWRAANWC